MCESTIDLLVRLPDENVVNQDYEPENKHNCGQNPRRSKEIVESGRVFRVEHGAQ